MIVWIWGVILSFLFWDGQDECGNYVFDDGRDTGGLSGDVFHVREIVQAKSALCRALQACNEKYNPFFSAAGGLDARLPVTLVFREYMIREIAIQKYLNLVCMQDLLGAKAYSMFCRKMSERWDAYSREFEDIMRSIRTPVSDIPNACPVVEFYSHEKAEAAGLKFKKPGFSDDGPELCFQVEDFMYMSWLSGPNACIDAMDRVISVSITQRQLDDAIAYAEMHRWGVDVSDDRGLAFCSENHLKCDCCGRPVSDCGPVGLYAKCPHRLSISMLREPFGSRRGYGDAEIVVMCQSCVHESRPYDDRFVCRGGRLSFDSDDGVRPLEPSEVGCRNFQYSDYVSCSDLSISSGVMNHGLVMRPGVRGRVRRFQDRWNYFREHNRGFRLMPRLRRKGVHSYIDNGWFSIPSRLYMFYWNVSGLLFWPFFKIAEIVHARFMGTSVWDCPAMCEKSDDETGIGLVAGPCVSGVLSALDSMNDRFRSMLADVPFVYDSGVSVSDRDDCWHAFREFAETHVELIRGFADGLKINRRLFGMYPDAYLSAIREFDGDFRDMTFDECVAAQKECRKHTIRIRTRCYVLIHVIDDSSQYDSYCSLETMCVAAGLGPILGENERGYRGENRVLGTGPEHV